MSAPLRKTQTGITSTLVDGFCGLGFEGKYPGRVRLRAPLAPSLTGHHMLPRTTQQSHSAAPRRESPIEPWLAHRHRSACVASAPERRRRMEVKTTSEPRDLRHSATPRGWMSRKLPFLPSKGKCFLLTSPFIEPRSFSPVLRKPSTKRDEAGAGAPHPGAQDRRHHLACLEERRTLRRRICEATSRLSAPLRKTRPESLPP